METVKEEKDLDNIEEYKQLKTTDIAKNLNIAESTVRKYAQVLEKQGYSFRKDPVQGRIYTQVDELAINELIRLRKEGNVGLDMAAEIVATRRTPKNMTVSPTRNVQPMQGNELAMQNITDLMHNIRHIQENMVSKEQVGYLMNSVEKVLDTNMELLKKLNESEEKRMEIEKENKIWKEKIDLIVDHIQDEDKQPEKKKGFLANLSTKLFG